MDIFYVNSKGDKIDFLSKKLAIQDPESLFKNTWEYTGTERSFGGSVERWSKSLQEQEITVSIFADDEDEFSEICKEMTDITEYDIHANVPGKIYVNGWYLECFIFSTAYSEFEDLMYVSDKNLTLLKTYPNWVYESYTDFHVTSDIKTDGLNYRHNFPFNFGFSIQTSKNIENSNTGESDFKIEIKGPVTDPTVTINGHEHTVFCTLVQNEILTIDSENKKIYSVYDGNVTNHFDDRDRENYIFEKIKPGEIVVTWDGNFEFRLFVRETRGEPVWK